MKTIFMLVSLTLLVSCAGSSGGSSKKGGGDQGCEDTLFNGSIIPCKEMSLTGSVSDFAGSEGLTGTDDGVGSAARFEMVSGITTDGKKLYVADNNKIRIIDIATQEVSTMVLADKSAASPNSSLTTDGEFLYYADSNRHIVGKINISTGAVSTIAGSIDNAGATNGTGTEAQFNAPAQIVTDGVNLYVADRGNYLIRKIVIKTGVVTTLAGSGVLGSDDGIGVAASFENPSGLALVEDRLYVMDSNTLREIIIDTQEVTTITFAGKEFAESPTHYITSDGANLYISNKASYSIDKVELATSTKSVLVPGAVKTINPGFAGITTDGKNLYFCDRNLYKVVKVD